MIREVRIHQFRCFENLDFFPAPHRTCIVGQNAEGKTSILEAVCVLLRLQSPRSSAAADLIRSGAEGFSIEGCFADTRLQYRQTVDGRTISMDSKVQSRSDDYLSTACVTWFSNADLDLVKGSASGRRRYLDFLGTQSVTGYRKALRDYDRALRSRNSLLKEGRPRREIAAFDLPLLDAGNVLLTARAELTAALAPLARASCLEISSTSDVLEMNYRPGCNGSFPEALAASRPEEERLRQTVCGPHRDDLELHLNSLKAAPFASEGQQRTIALALKIAQARRIKDTHNKSPVLLLDDVFGELDTTRRNQFLHALPSDAQTLITTTFLDWATDGVEMAVLNLAGKKLTPAIPK